MLRPQLIRLTWRQANMCDSMIGNIIRHHDDV